MPTTSMVQTADSFVSATKKMQNASKSLTKDLDKVQNRVDKLNKTLTALTTSTDKAEKAFQTTEKQVSKTGDALSEMFRQGKQLDSDEICQKISTVAQTVADAKKQVQDAGKALSNIGNIPHGETSQTKAMVETIAKSEIGKAGIALVKDSFNFVVSSAFGSNIGETISSTMELALSGAATGYMLGNFFGLPGAAVGALVGGTIGAVKGGVSILEKRDSAFKTYYQDAFNAQISAQEASLTSGSILAAQRETDRTSFAMLFGKDGGKNEALAEAYLSKVADTANQTPLTYDNLVSMSKTLVDYGFRGYSDQSRTLSREKDYGYILDVLQTVGDAGMALGHSASDMEAVAAAIGQMRSSGAVSSDSLNVLSGKGIQAMEMLAGAKGISQEEVSDLVSRGSISGREAAEIILKAMEDSFSGAMLAQSNTFSGLTSTVESLTQELDTAMGEGYNQGRMAGLAAQKDWLSGESSKSITEANQAIGAWKAELENSKEQYIRDAMDAMMKSSKYQTAKTAGDAAEMGRLIMEAKVQGMNEYNASEGAQLALASEKALADAIRNDTGSNSDYWDAGYEKGQWFTKGLAAAIGNPITISTGFYADEHGLSVDPMLVDPGGISGWMGSGAKSKAHPSQGLHLRGFSAGLDCVPYDNFPALLHQGERVQTAVEARSERTMPAITITGNSFTVREEADISRVASELLAQMELAGMRG